MEKEGSEEEFWAHMVLIAKAKQTKEAKKRKTRHF